MEGSGERPVVEGGEEAVDAARFEGYAVRAAAVAGLALGVGRFVGYLDTAGNAFVDGYAYFNWWAAWVAGVGLLAASLLHDDEDVIGAAVLAALGIAVLLLGTQPF